jgi:hypothetical protein
MVIFMAMILHEVDVNSRAQCLSGWQFLDFRAELTSA